MLDYAKMTREEVEHAARNAEQQYRVLKAKQEREGGTMAGMPWQVRAAMWFGLPATLLAFFFLQDAGIVPSLARSTHLNVMVSAAAMNAHVQRTDELITKLTHGLRIMCENAAHDQAARNNCGDIR